MPPPEARDLTIGSLFTGIGGWELGLERAGLGPVLWQVEKDPYCRRVLERHYPGVPRHDDVCDVCTDERPLPRVHALCGSFPCQDISSAGRYGRGLDGAYSGLWYEFARIIVRLKPPLVLIENVASGKRRWLREVRRHLHVLGYDADAYHLSAADVGAPHLRRRIFVVAHALSVQLRVEPGRREGARGQGPDEPVDAGLERTPADAHEAQREGDRGPVGDAKTLGTTRRPRASWDARERHEQVAGMRGMANRSSPWTSPPEFRGVADGVPHRLERLRALGNAVVPQNTEAIGRMVVARARRYDYRL